jgi:hypothetical protein
MRASNGYARSHRGTSGSRTDSDLHFRNRSYTGPGTLPTYPGDDPTESRCE